LSGIIVVERELLKSDAFRQLNGTAKTVYFDFLMKCRVKSRKPKSGRKRERDILNNGELEYTYSEAEKRGLPRATFMRAIDNLVNHGFLDIFHSGSGGKKGDKSLYAISERWEFWGTDTFIPISRPKDTRAGRGFKKGSDHWRSKETSTIKPDVSGMRAKLNTSLNMGFKSDNSTVITSDNRKQD
jgi:hypothetical protein